MSYERDKEKDGFLNATELLKIRGISNAAWEDFEKSENSLPIIGKKYFEPNGSWLEKKQLESGLKNRKRCLEIERVNRLSQLAVAEWLPGIQKARVTKRSGLAWENFGMEERCQLYLLPEEALILLEMNLMELYWNGMPLSVQQAYEVIINSNCSKCTLDEYRVYSQLVRWGYRLQRFQDKSSSDNKSNNTKRIIMNPEGLWMPSASFLEDDLNSPTKNHSKEMSHNISLSKDKEKLERDKFPRAKIISEETVLGNIKIVKNNTITKNTSVPLQVTKWTESCTQSDISKKIDDINVKIFDKNDSKKVLDKRKNVASIEDSPIIVKKMKPEIIELSDDEIEEIPRPMTRREILNTLPNLANTVTEVVIEIPRAYIPHTVKPREYYRYDRNRLLNLNHSNDVSGRQIIPVQTNGQTSHFYSEGNQSIIPYNSNNYSFRNVRYQSGGGSFLNNTFSGTIFQSNHFNFVMEVMVRSFRQIQQATICQLFSPRSFPCSQRYQSYSDNYFGNSSRYQYGRRPYGGLVTGYQRGRGRRFGGHDSKSLQDEVSVPSFSKRSGVSTWSELKNKWREESTITIEDEEPMETGAHTDSEVQVVEESVNPLINSKGGIASMSDVYERLRIIKSASDKSVRSRKVDYSLSYEVFPANKTFRKAIPGEPMCRIFVLNSKKESFLDASKLQRLQQDSKESPVVVAFVSQSCISYIQPSVVHLPKLS